MTSVDRDLSSLITDDWMVHGDVYRSPEVFAAEMATLFSRSWVYLLHASEIPEPGSFKRTEIGGAPLLAWRDRSSGRVRVFYNRCRHRGALLCDEPCGSAPRLRCAYHGWTYGSDGSLQGVPLAQAYGDDFDKGDMGLVELPAVDEYRGFVFGAQQEPDQPLATFLGPTCAYLDHIHDVAGPEGISLDAGAHRLVYPGNWKLQMENSVDMYHVAVVHESYLKLLEERGEGEVMWTKNVRSNPDWITRDLGNGHGAHDFGRWRETTGDGVGHGAAIGDLPFNLSIFPNLAIIGSHVRVVKPKSVDRTEVDLLPIIFNRLSDEENQARINEHESFYGPSGFGTVDDLEVAFRRVGEGLLAQPAREDWVSFQRGAGMEKTEDDGTLIGHSADELPLRSFYGVWKAMVGGAA